MTEQHTEDDWDDAWAAFPKKFHKEYRDSVDDHYGKTSLWRRQHPIKSWAEIAEAEIAEEQARKEREERGEI